MEVAVGAFPYGKWSTIFEQLNAVVSGPAPQLPANTPHSHALRDFIAAWWVLHPDCVCVFHIQHTRLNMNALVVVSSKTRSNDPTMKSWCSILFSRSLMQHGWTLVAGIAVSSLLQSPQSNLAYHLTVCQSITLSHIIIVVVVDKTNHVNSA